MKRMNITGLLVVAACIWSVAASAQIEKGKWALNAALNFETQKVTAGYENDAVAQTNKNNGYSVSIGFGRFVSNSFYAGIEAGYADQTMTHEVTTSGSTKRTDKLFTGGVQLKWYKKLGGRFYYNLSGDFTYESEKATYTTVDSFSVPPNVYETQGKAHGFIARISPLQITFALSHKFLVEAGFGYLQYSTVKTSQNSATGTQPDYVNKLNDFHVNLSPIVSNFTFTWVFGK